MDSTKLGEINTLQAEKALASTRHEENMAHTDNVAQTVLSATSSLIQYLEGHTSKTEVVNQLESIATPDVKYVVEALQVLDATMQKHENTDLTEITGVMRELLSQAEQIPKSFPEQKEPEVIDYTKQLNSLKDAIQAVEKVVKAQKLIAEAPVVNVPETNVHVDAPDLEPLQTAIKAVVKAVEGIVIPEYKTDNTGVEKLLKSANSILQKLLEKPVGSGGGGGGIASYQSNTGVTTQVMLTAEGSVPTRDMPMAVKIDDSSTANTIYIGKAVIGSNTSSAVWQIAKLNTTSGLVKTWADGDANFNNVFDNCTSLTYQ